jgi:hypothetical protein
MNVALVKKLWQTSYIDLVYFTPVFFCCREGVKFSLWGWQGCYICHPPLSESLSWVGDAPHVLS